MLEIGCTPVDHVDTSEFSPVFREFKRRRRSDFPFLLFSSCSWEFAKRRRIDLDEIFQKHSSLVDRASFYEKALREPLAACSQAVYIFTPHLEYLGPGDEKDYLFDYWKQTLDAGNHFLCQDLEKISWGDVRLSKEPIPSTIRDLFEEWYYSNMLRQSQENRFFRGDDFSVIQKYFDQVVIDLQWILGEKIDSFRRTLSFFMRQYQDFLQSRGAFLSFKTDENVPRSHKFEDMCTEAAVTRGDVLGISQLFFAFPSENDDESIRQYGMLFDAVFQRLKLAAEGSLDPAIMGGDFGRDLSQFWNQKNTGSVGRLLYHYWSLFALPLDTEEIPNRNTENQKKNILEMIQKHRTWKSGSAGEKAEFIRRSIPRETLDAALQEELRAVESFLDSLDVNTIAALHVRIEKWFSTFCKDPRAKKSGGKKGDKKKDKSKKKAVKKSKKKNRK